MSGFKMLKGFEGIGDGTIDLDGSTIKAALLDLVAFTDVGIKAISAASNATPIVITSNSHGFSNGDLVLIDGVLGNLAANGVWKVANVTTNTFELTRPDGTNAVGSAAYTSGGYAVNLGPGASGDNLDDFDGARLGTDQTLAGLTFAGAVFDATDPTWTSVTAGNNVRAVLLYKDTGTASTSRVFYLIVGKQIVTCNTQAASSATSIPCEPLQNAIPSGTTLVFSNGATAVLSALASAGDRALTVSALAATITAGSRALAPVTSANFPLATNGGNVTVQFDNGAYRIFSLAQY